MFYRQYILTRILSLFCSTRVLHVLQYTCPPCFAVHVSSQHALSNYSCCCLVQLIMKLKERHAVYCVEVSGEVVSCRVVSSAVVGTACTGLQLHINRKNGASVVRRNRSVGRAFVRTCPAFTDICVARQWRMQIKFSFGLFAPTVVQRYITDRCARSSTGALCRLFL
jgi:hypothetical protein